MRNLPTGTITFLFTDIEGSTRLLDSLGDGYADVLAEHHRLLRAVWREHDGVEVDNAGDAFFVAFRSAEAACAAAVEAQAVLRVTPLRVRMGLHTGRPLVTETGYVGLDVHRAARIAAAAHGGQVILSGETRALVSVPVADLGLHRLKDLRTPERLFQLGSDAFPPLRTMHASNLPAPVNELVGRQGEVSVVAALLRAGRRLVTLTGAGGSGKTRLSLAVAAELREEFADGVWFVPLAAVSDPALVAGSIARTLGARGPLADELRGRNTLLVLDNFEQVIDAAAELPLLLAEAPGLSLLVTSRVRLNVSGEREHVVHPLEVDAAVELFLARAAAAGIELEETEDVVALARALDGLPLALELAAARVKLLSPGEILRRLQGGLDLLSSAARDAPERQRTLRATIEWSLSLLTDAERESFERLGVFPGSFDLAAAGQVADVGLEALGSLVDQSLVVRRGERLFLLETIRSVALEQASASGFQGSLWGRHADHYAALAARLDPETRGARQGEAVATLAIEQPNIRQALSTLEGADDPLPFARLVASLAYYWYLGGLFSEGIGIAERALDRLAGRDVPEMGRVANTIAMLSAVGGDPERAAHLGELALAVGRRFDEVPIVLRALLCCATSLAARHDWQGFLELIEEMRRLAEGTDPWMYALAVVNRGVAKRELGGLEDARDDLALAVELVSALGDTDLLIGTLCNAGHVELQLGELAAANDDFTEALRLVRGQPLAEVTIWSLDALAVVAVRSGDTERAARLLGAAEGLAASVGYANPGTREELDRTRGAIEERLGAPLTGALCAEGAALDTDAAIELGLGASLD